MSWMKPAIDSIYQLLGHPGRMAPLAPDVILPVADMEEVRDAMLDLIIDSGVAWHHPALHLKIQYATSIETLWYARCDVMAALACHVDEATARQQLAAVTRLFVGLLPEARPSLSMMRPQRPARAGRRAARSWI